MTHKQMDNGTIRIYDASATPLIIQEGETNNELTRILCDTTQKYVGIVTSTNGDHRHPLKYLRSICHTFIQQLQKSYINREDADIAFQYMFKPKIMYQLMLSSIPNDDLIALQRTYEKYIIAKKGFNSNWPLQLRYGTHNMLGLELPNLHVEQTAAQLRIIVKFVKTPKYHDLINHVLNMLQLQSGLTKDILENPTNIDYTKSTWITQLVAAMKNGTSNYSENNPYG